MLRPKNSIQEEQEVYNQIYSSNQKYYGPKKIFQQILQWVPNLRHDCIVEFGCGVGELATMLYKQNPNIHYTGYDFSSIAIEKAVQKNSSKQMQFVVEDLQTVSLENNNALYISCQTLEHLSQKNGDVCLIEKIPHNSYFIFSVPLNAPGKMHYRTYINLEDIKTKYEDYLTFVESTLIREQKHTRCLCLTLRKE
jgi:trans-aconitate methyltransferase